MSKTDSIALVSAIATWMGVIVTGVFSFLVWKATQQTANITREMRSNKKEVYFNLILQNVDSIWKFLHRPNDGDKLELENYEKLQKNPGISNEKIAEHFDKDEKDNIIALWKNFDRYIKDYWTAENGTIGQLSSGRGIKDAEIAASKLSKEFLDFAVKYRMYYDGE